MSKTPTLEDRRAARKAEVAEDARRQEEAAREDAQLNLPVLEDLMKDVALLDEIAGRIKSRSADLIVTNQAGQTFVGQAETLTKLQDNLHKLGQAMIAHGQSILAVTEE